MINGNSGCGLVTHKSRTELQTHIIYYINLKILTTSVCSKVKRPICSLHVHIHAHVYSIMPIRLSVVLCLTVLPHPGPLLGCILLGPRWCGLTWSLSSTRKRWNLEMTGDLRMKALERGTYQARLLGYLQQENVYGC